jgi:hypothetical protein
MCRRCSIRQRLWKDIVGECEQVVVDDVKHRRRVELMLCDVPRKPLIDGEEHRLFGG